MKLRYAVLALFVLVLGAGSASASTEFVYYIGNTSVAGSGDIHELSSADGTKWTDNDLTAERGFSAAATVSNTVSFVTEGNGARHIFYFDLNRDVIEISNINNTWMQVQLATNAGAPPANGAGFFSGMTAFGDAYGQHVFYVGASGDLIHLYSNSCELSCANGSWKLKDLKSAPKPGNVMSSFTDPQGDHIFYFGCPAGTPCQSDLIEVSQSGGPTTSPQVQDLSLNVPGIPNGANASITEAMASPMIAFADQWGEHIFYGNGDLNQVYCSSGCSQQKLLANSVASFPIAGSTDGQGEHIFYFSSIGNSDLNEDLYSGNAWSSTDLTSVAPLALAAPTTAMVSFPDQLGEHLFYTDVKGQLNEYTSIVVIHHTTNSRGQTLTWSTTNRTNVLISAGKGAIMPSGSTITGFSQ